MKILCFAETKKEVARELKKESENLYEHLIKVWMFPNSQSQNHWKTEIGTKFLTKVDKLKNKKKYPTSKFIIENTWDVWEDALIDRIPSILARIDEVPLTLDYSIVYDAIHGYIFWASDTLSQKGVLNPNDCYDKIEEIRNKYFKEDIC